MLSCLVQIRMVSLSPTANAMSPSALSATPLRSRAVTAPGFSKVLPPSTEVRRRPFSPTATIVSPSSLSATSLKSFPVALSGDLQETSLSAETRPRPMAETRTRPRLPTATAVRPSPLKAAARRVSRESPSSRIGFMPVAVRMKDILPTAIAFPFSGLTATSRKSTSRQSGVSAAKIPCTISMSCPATSPDFQSTQTAAMNNTTTMLKHVHATRTMNCARLSKSEHSESNWVSAPVVSQSRTPLEAII